jgi:AcrR family transcriptional regulator
MSASSARERVLDAAVALFYRHGINSVGIDAVVAEAGVAKMTLYHHFPSKDDLVVAFLEKMSTDWMAWLRARVTEHAGRSQPGPLHVFEALEEWFATPEFRGCPFISTAAEFRDPGHPAHAAAWRFKRGLRDYFVELLSSAGRPSTPALADQLLLLADGAIVRAAMEGGPGAAIAARSAAEAVLSVRKPRATGRASRG